MHALDFLAKGEPQQSATNAVQAERVSTGPCQILHGTFEEHELFFQNTMQLNVDLKAEDFGEEILRILCEDLSRCVRLAKVTLCVGNLTTKDAEQAFNEISEILHTFNAVRKQKIGLQRERSAEYDATQREREMGRSERLVDLRKTVQEFMRRENILRQT
jgi:hypothetical protein